MAKKRMFNYDVLDTDAFLEMPLSAQALYFHLNMRADDDGFISNPKRVQAYIGASEDDLKLLVVKRFVITFEDGVIVIKHWRMHNTIQKDRYHPTNYQENLARLGIKNNKSYTLNLKEMETKCIQDVSSDIGLDLDRDVEKRSINTSSRSSGRQTSEPEADVEALILNDGSEWRPTEALFAEYVRLYPNVDVKQQFNVMRSWCLSNPKKRKTRRGVTRFVNSWLTKEQDKGYRRPADNGSYQQRQSESGYSQDVLNRLASESRSDLNG